MSKSRKPEIPSPAIDGFLEVTLASLQTGTLLTDQAKETLGLINAHEAKVAEGKRTPEVRRDSAHYNLGRIVALRAFYGDDEQSPDTDRIIGFAPGSDNSTSSGR